MKIKLLCVKPSKTTSMYTEYLGDPVRKGSDDGTYNNMWTRLWEECNVDKCTSYRITDDIGTTRYLTKKRFDLITD